MCCRLVFCYAIEDIEDATFARSKITKGKVEQRAMIAWPEVNEIDVLAVLIHRPGRVQRINRVESVVTGVQHVAAIADQVGFNTVVADVFIELGGRDIPVHGAAINDVGQRLGFAGVGDGDITLEEPRNQRYTIGMGHHDRAVCQANNRGCRCGRRTETATGQAANTTVIHTGKAGNPVTRIARYSYTPAFAQTTRGGSVPPGAIRKFGCQAESGSIAGEQPVIPVKLVVVHVPEV